MRVWIVEGHIAYEGSEIVSVHSTQKKAEEKREYWESIIKLQGEEKYKLEFGYCCDFTVTEHEVKE